MVAQVVGVRRVDMKDNDGKSINGESIQIVRKPSSRDTTVNGFLIDKIFVHDSSQIKIPDLVFGECYDFVYEMDGKKPFLDDIKPMPKGTKL